jgi:hypothetical protein
VKYMNTNTMITVWARKNSLAKKSELIYYNEHIVTKEVKMEEQEKKGSMKFKFGGTIPGVWGEYSSLTFGIEVEEYDVNLLFPEKEHKRMTLRYVAIMVNDLNYLLNKLGKPELAIEYGKKAGMNGGRTIQIEE